MKPTPTRPVIALQPVPFGIPLLRLGFRPFYLAAALCAVGLMLAWYGVFFGRIVPRTGLAPVLWHAHEMLFGFVAAVIVGFLFTAGKSWTNLATPRGALLGWLVALWASARVASVAAPYPAFFFLDVAFLPLVAALFLDLLVRARNRRNLPIAAILILLSLGNLGFHLAATGVIAVEPMRFLHAGIALVIVLESLIAGRVVPMFTMNATPGLKLRDHRHRDAIAVALSALGLALWACDVAPRASAVALAIAALLHFARLLSWSPRASLGRPILWILQFSYAWIPTGLALLGAAQAGMLGASAGVHALTVGSMGGLTIGMMTRTARGHTGRPLEASRIEVAAYVLLLAAAATRVLAPFLAGLYVSALTLAGALWCAAFTGYLIKFAPWLATTRADGRDG